MSEGHVQDIRKVAAVSPRSILSSHTLQQKGPLKLPFVVSAGEEECFKDKETRKRKTQQQPLELYDSRITEEEAIYNKHAKKIKWTGGRQLSNDPNRRSHHFFDLVNLDKIHPSKPSSTNDIKPSSNDDVLKIDDRINVEHPTEHQITEKDGMQSPDKDNAISHISQCSANINNTNNVSPKGDGEIIPMDDGNRSTKMSLLKINKVDAINLPKNDNSTFSNNSDKAVGYDTNQVRSTSDIKKIDREEHLSTLDSSSNRNTKNSSNDEFLSNNTIRPPVDDIENVVDHPVAENSKRNIKKSLEVVKSESYDPFTSLLMARMRKEEKGRQISINSKIQPKQVSTLRKTDSSTKRLKAYPQRSTRLALVPLEFSKGKEGSTSLFPSKKVDGSTKSLKAYPQRSTRCVSTPLKSNNGKEDESCIKTPKECFARTKGAHPIENQPKNSLAQKRTQNQFNKTAVLIGTRTKKPKQIKEVSPKNNTDDADVDDTEDEVVDTEGSLKHCSLSNRKGVYFAKRSKQPFMDTGLDRKAAKKIFNKTTAKDTHATNIYSSTGVPKINKKVNSPETPEREIPKTVNAEVPTACMTKLDPSNKTTGVWVVRRPKTIEVKEAVPKMIRKCLSENLTTQSESLAQKTKQNLSSKLGYLVFRRPKPIKVEQALSKVAKKRTLKSKSHTSAIGEKAMTVDRCLPSSKESYVIKNDFMITQSSVTKQLSTDSVSVKPFTDEKDLPASRERSSLTKTDDSTLVQSTTKNINKCSAKSIESQQHCSTTLSIVPSLSIIRERLTKTAGHIAPPIRKLNDSAIKPDGNSQQQNGSPTTANTYSLRERPSKPDDSLSKQEQASSSSASSAEIVQNGVCIDHKILTFDRDSKTEDDSRFNFINFVDCNNTDRSVVVGRNRSRSLKRKRFKPTLAALTGRY